MLLDTSTDLSCKRLCSLAVMFDFQIISLSLFAALSLSSLFRCGSCTNLLPGSVVLCVRDPDGG